jgi:hypothetical protein
MHDLKAKTDKRFQHLVGKKIQVMCKGRKWIGTLQFAGLNGLHGQFQVTINRMPIWPVNPNTIKLYQHWSQEL